MNHCCNVCFEEKPDEDFYKNRTSGKIEDYRCKKCQAKRYKKYISKNPVKKRKYTLKPLAIELGISAEELFDIYNELFSLQNGCCKICGVHASELGRSLDIDHCHDDKKIRGLLCNRCNKAIGNFGNSPELCKLGAEYLENYLTD